MTLEEVVGSSSTEKKMDNGRLGSGDAAGRCAQTRLSHGWSLRVRQAHECRPRQRGPVRPGHGRRGRGRHRAADPLHAAPGVLLRQRHQHPARVGAAASGPAARREARPERERTARPALHPGHESSRGPAAVPGSVRHQQLLCGESMQEPVGAGSGAAGALKTAKKKTVKNVTRNQRSTNHSASPRPLTLERRGLRAFEGTWSRGLLTMLTVLC